MSVQQKFLQSYANTEVRTEQSICWMQQSITVHTPFMLNTPVKVNDMCIILSYTLSRIVNGGRVAISDFVSYL